MKWLIAVVRHHRAVVSVAATALLDVAHGAPLLAALARALAGATHAPLLQ